MGLQPPRGGGGFFDREYIERRASWRYNNSHA